MRYLELKIQASEQGVETDHSTAPWYGDHGDVHR